MRGFSLISSFSTYSIMFFRNTENLHLRKLLKIHGSDVAL